MGSRQVDIVGFEQQQPHSPEELMVPTEALPEPQHTPGLSDAAAERVRRETSDEALARIEKESV